MPFNNTQAYSFAGGWIEAAGVYGIMNQQWQMIYIGEAENLQEIMLKYLNDKTHCMHQYDPSLVLVEFIISDSDRRNRVRELIVEYSPLCNQSNN